MFIQQQRGLDPILSDLPKEQISFRVRAAIFDFFVVFEWHLKIAGLAFVNQPCPKFGNGIDRIIKTVRGDEDVSVKEMKHSAPTPGQKGRRRPARARRFAALRPKLDRLS